MIQPTELQAYICLGFPVIGLLAHATVPGFYIIPSNPNLNLYGQAVSSMSSSLFFFFPFETGFNLVAWEVPELTVSLPFQFPER